MNITLSSAPSHPRIYGRRKGRMLGSQRQNLMETLLPQLRIALPEEGQLTPETIIPYKQTWLEIGFGTGEHLIAQALRHRETGFIGCDAFTNAVASLLKSIDQTQVSNIRIFDADARKLVQCLSDACIDRIFILFPDPWPKARHHKRRIMQPEFIRELTRVLKPGGVLRFASDIEDYIDQALALVHDQQELKRPLGDRAEWQTPPNDWVETKYEQRGKRLGHICHYLDFMK